jgi:MoxR-like ATPase
VLEAHARGFDPRDLAAAGIARVAAASDLAAATTAIRGLHVDQQILAYIVELVRATRAAPSSSLGVSPRGATALLATARAWAWLSGRDFVTPDDVQALARATFRHRIQLRPEAELEGVTVDSVLDAVLASVPAPR